MFNYAAYVVILILIWIESNSNFPYKIGFASNKNQQFIAEVS